MILSKKFKPFFHDVLKKLGRKFYLLVFLSSFVAIADGFRILIAFQILQFIGIAVDSEFNQLVAQFFSSLNISHNVFTVSFFVVAVFLFQAILASFQSWLHGSYINFYTYEWRYELFSLLTKTKWQFYLNSNAGHLINILSNETSRLSSALSKFLTFQSNALIAIAYVIAAMMVSIDASLTMVFIGLFIWFLNSLFLRHLVKHAIAIVQGNNAMMVVAQEFLNNIKVIKTSTHMFRLDLLVSVPLKIIFNSERIGFFIPNFSRIVAELLVMLIIVFGVLIININGVNTNQSDLLLVFILFVRAYSKMTMTMTAAQQMSVLLPAFDLILKTHNELLFFQEANWNDGSNDKKNTFNEAISFRDASVLIDGKKVLKNISLEISKCSVVAIVGPSGSGKTTLVDTLLRLIETSSGGVFEGEINSRNFNINTWRSKFGYVTQDNNLITGTIKDNIKLFSPNASDSDVERAAQLSNCAGFIEALPEKYNTHIGSSGFKLSGGQRQRIAIARVLINDPEIIILDEATSALDGNSENSILEAIYKFRDTKTIIVIAHRLETIKAADNIIVLNHGKIMEQGSCDLSPELAPQL